MPGIETYLSRDLFTADFAHPEVGPRKSYTLTTAQEVGSKEKWLRDAISREPEIVLAPCRAAGLVGENEQWYFWKKEMPVPDAGNVDVLLISRSGRVGIVETKLAYNPEARRTVVAQILEYAINFSSIPKLPAIPRELGQSLDEQTIRNAVQDGEYLLIIAGDQLDSRAVKLSQDVLGKHLLRPWALALVEIAIFKQENNSGETVHLLVPHIRGTVIPVQREVVKIEIKGDPTKVDVTAAPVSTGWSEDAFFAKAKGGDLTVRQFAEELRRLNKEHPDEVSLAFGRGATPSMTLQRAGQGILTLNLAGSGSLNFNPPAFPRALGQEQGNYYLKKLEALFPQEIKKGYVKLQPKSAKRDLDAILVLLGEVLMNAPTHMPSDVAAPS
jgi:hypothetical protein